MKILTPFILAIVMILLVAATYTTTKMSLIQNMKITQENDLFLVEIDGQVYEYR